MADKPIMKQDLVESILELRNEAERRLMRNKYYLAMRKLDDLLDVLRPLEAEVIEEGANVSPAAALTSGRDTGHGDLEPRHDEQDEHAPRDHQSSSGSGGDRWQAGDGENAFRDSYAAQNAYAARQGPAVPPDTEQSGHQAADSAWGDADMEGDDEEAAPRRGADFGA